VKDVVTERDFILSLDKEINIRCSPIDLPNSIVLWYNPYSDVYTVKYNGKQVLITISQQEAFDKYNNLKYEALQNTGEIS